VRAAHLGGRRAPGPRGASPAALAVPLALGDRTVGALAVCDRRGRRSAFDARDERELETFALGAATVLAVARAVARDGARRALRAGEEERRRWARELHDETLQELGALRVLLGGARERGDPDALAGAVDAALACLAEQAAALRALLADLRPAALERFGLRAAVEDLAARVRARGGLEVRLDVALGRSSPRALTSEVELAVYRTVQEALANVVRHARASRADGEVRVRDGHVVARVADDGRGFAVPERAWGTGLQGIRERLRLLGGACAVQSAPGRGTTVRAVIPLARARG
jgi:signal transduction histidine kinase